MITMRIRGRVTHPWLGVVAILAIALTYATSLPESYAAPIPSGPGSTASVIRTDGTAAYVLSSGASQISVVEPSTNTLLYTIPLSGMPPGTCQGIDWNESAQRLMVGCNNGQILSVDPATSTVATLVNIPGNNYSLVSAENWSLPGTFGWALESSTGWLHQITPGGVVVPATAMPMAAYTELKAKAWDASAPTILDGYLVLGGTSGGGFATVDVFDRALFVSSPLMTWMTQPANVSGVDSGLGGSAFVTANTPGGVPGFLLRVDFAAMAFAPAPVATYVADSAMDVSVSGTWVSVLSTDSAGVGGSKISVYDSGDPANILLAGHLPVVSPAAPAGGMDTWLGAGASIDDLYEIHTNQGQNADGNDLGESKEEWINAAPPVVASNLWPVTTPAEAGALGQEALVCTQCPPHDAGGRGRLAGVPDGVQIAYSGSERSVQYATGEEVYVQPVLQVPGVGMSLELNLTYRSRRDFDFRYGQGWFLSADVRMRTEPSGDRTYQSPYGRMDTYTFQPGGAYISPAHYDTSLSVGPTTTVTNRFGRVLTFDANGYRISEADRYGNTIQYTYVGDQLTQITDTLGRIYTLNYNATGRLSSIVDYGGRTWSMSYDYLGQLRTLMTPASVQFPQGRALWFSYSGNNAQARFRSNLTHVWSARGVRVQSLTYNAFDRVVSESIGGDLYQFSYDVSTQTTTVIDRSGNTSAWTFGSAGVLTQHQQFTKGLRVGEPASFVTSYGVAPNGMVTSVVKPAGNRVDMVYDSALNLTELRLREANTTTNASTDIVWSYQYTGPYNQTSQVTDPRGNVTTYTVDGQGNTTQIARPTVTNPASQSIVELYTFDARGRVLSATDGSGVAVAMTYYAAGPQFGYLKDVTRDPGGLGLTTTYGYDVFGNVTSVTDPKGGVTSITVDAENFVTEIAAPSPFGHRRRMTYDDNRSVTRIEVENVDRKGVVDPSIPWIATDFAYDDLARRTSMTRRISASQYATTSYEYEGSGLVSAVVHPEGNRDEIEYDERLLPFRYTRGAGTTEAATTQVDYDLNGNVAKTADGLGNASTFAYDKFDRRTRATDALGHYVDITYDKSGNVSSLAAYDSAMVLLAKTERFHDEVNRLWKSVAHRFGPGLSPSFPATTFTRDQAGRLLQITDPLSNQTTMVYDGAGRLLTRTDAVGNKQTLAYDANGNVTQVDDLEIPASGAAETHVREFSYDALNRLTEIREVDRLNSSNKLLAVMEYDSRGNLTFRTDAEGNPSRWVYDLGGRLTMFERALQVGAQIDDFVQSIDESFGYDKNDRLTVVTDDNFNATSYTYDALSRRTKSTFADGKFTTYVYDKADNLVGSTDKNGSVISSTFDALNRVSSRAVTLGAGVLGTTSESYSYDALGRMVAASDNDYQLEWTWDSVDNLLKERQGYTAIGLEKWKAVSTSYTDAGSIAAVNYPNGLAITHSRDAIYRLTGLFDVAASANVATFAWQGGARLATTTNQNGTSTDYTYDGFRRVSAIDHNLSTGATFHGFEYAYDKVHNRRMEKNTFDATWVSSLPAAVQAFLNGRGGKGDVYAYDMAYRLVDARYDVTNPLTEVLNPTTQTYGSLVAYTLDGVGNRSQVQSTVPPGGPASVVYAADVVNQYTSVGGTARVHDNNGNVSDDGTHTFAYDYRNRLVELKLKSTGATVASYRYDPLGRRVEKAVSGGATTRYILRGRAILEEYDGSGGWQANYIHEDGVDALRAMDRIDVSDVDADGNTTEIVRLHVHQNAQGSTSELTSPGGAVVEWVTYDVYGVPTIRDKNGVVVAQSAVGNPFLYTGREYDAESGLYHFRARTYDPVTGRFQQRDPTGYVDGLSLYEYVRSSPVTRVDPLGLESEAKKARAAATEARARADALQTKVNSLKAKLSALEAQLSNIDARMEQLKKLIGLARRQCDRVAGTRHKDRLPSLEAGLQSMEKQLEDMESEKADGLPAKIAAVKAEIKSAEAARKAAEAEAKRLESVASNAERDEAEKARQRRNTQAYTAGLSQDMKYATWPKKVAGTAVVYPVVIVGGGLGDLFMIAIGRTFWDDNYEAFDTTKEALDVLNKRYVGELVMMNEKDK